MFVLNNSSGDCVLVYAYLNVCIKKKNNPLFVYVWRKTMYQTVRVRSPRRKLLITIKIKSEGQDDKENMKLL